MQDRDSFNGSRCAWNNETELLALKCVREEHGSFYDVCNRQCMSDVYFLYLSQDLGPVVYGLVFPILVVLVVVANVLVALVLSQKHMVTPTNVVLKYMAVADLCVALVALPWNFYYYTMKMYEHEDQLTLTWCYAYKASMDALPPIFHSIAVWLTVLLAGQRRSKLGLLGRRKSPNLADWASGGPENYPAGSEIPSPDSPPSVRFISIEFPLRSREFCSIRNVRKATIVITLVSLLCGLPKAVDFYYDVFDGLAFAEPSGFRHVRRCVSGFTVVVKAIGSNTFFNVYFWTRVFGFILIPSFLLTILNTLLIRGIRRAQKRKEKLLREKRQREAQRQTDTNSTSIMLVSVVSIFLVVNLPQAIFMGLLCLSSTLGVQSELFQGTFPVTFMLISNMLVMATYPINFCLYCLMSSSFRDTFRLIFCRYKKQWRHRLASQAGSGSAVFNRLSVRRPDHVQLSACQSSDAPAEPSTAGGQLATVVRHENDEVKSGKNDTVFL